LEDGDNFVGEFGGRAGPVGDGRLLEAVKLVEIVVYGAVAVGLLEVVESWYRRREVLTR
jgi:hypothetical protein